MKKTIMRLLFPLLIIVLLLPITTVSAVGNSQQLIIINKSANKLAYFNNGEIVKIFDVATGKSDTLTPEGTFMIVNKIKNRPYYKDNIPGGHPSNPLGDRWLGLNARGTYGTTYAIHGNSNPKSIGKYVSGGCVRMYDEEVRWLFNEISLYTTVIIGHFDSFENAAKKAGYELLPPVGVMINDEVLTLEENPFLQDGRVLIPLRAIFSALGANVIWDGATKSITASKDGNVTELTVNSKDAYINGQVIALDVPAKIMSERTYVPVRFVTEALGSKVTWDPQNRRVTIYVDIENAASETEINVVINGRLVHFDAEIILEDGLAIIPLQETLVQIGATVTVDEEKQLIVAEKGEDVTEFYVSEMKMVSNGQVVEIDPKFQKINDQIYLPANILAEVMEVNIQLDEKKSHLEING